MFRSGYIAILGRPNVGKSTLFNRLVGEKLAAVTPKPQTTRHKILGIKTLPAGQLLFLDTPGLHKPHKELNQYMMEVAREALNGADLFLFLVEPRPEILEEERGIYKKIRDKEKPILLILTKTDRVEKGSLLPVMEAWQREFQPNLILPISAATGEGLDRLEEEVLARLPEGPCYYPDDQVSDVTERFIAAEIVREKAMLQTREEIPYSLAVVIESYEEPEESDKKKVVRIGAAIVVERDSQKGIVIGKGGQRIKEIGQEARKELETRLGQKVYLELFVRVEEGWTKDPKKVKELAFS